MEEVPGELVDKRHQLRRVTQALGQLQLVREPSPEQIQAALWQGARSQSQCHLDALAQRLEMRASSEGLLLPEPLLPQFAEVEWYMRHRLLVHETWGAYRRGLARHRYLRPLLRPARDGQEALTAGPPLRSAHLSL